MSDIALIDEIPAATALGRAARDFYAGIPPFSVFSELSEARHFRPVPEDWSVIITDVVGSTRAIEAGRYKDVNRIGAAAIVCARRGMEQREFPYVFGGDGATLVIPPERLDAVLAELAALQQLSASRFDLELRVGAVPVRTLLAHGATLEVARFRIAHDKCIGILRGGGIARAEHLVKQGEAGCGRAVPVPMVDLDDLSCRWNAVPATRGVVASLVVVAAEGDATSVYRSLLRDLEEIVDHGLDAANPIRREAMRYRGWWACIRDEARHYPTVWSLAYLSKCLGITVAVATLRYRVPAFFYDPATYSASVPEHSDYRKFDDALRMVLDCEPEQVARLKTYLDARYRAGELYYGLHEAPHSLITCFVQSTAPGEHIHFVDGGEGGYAVAARQLKAQLSAPGRGECPGHPGASSSGQVPRTDSSSSQRS